ncbi:hypothetical protein E5329_17280 [Petralouisia muris]|uniref:Uncharacterized protein n=1 Tax=Petralouisia muris TaxID=3032872 RepID=A0AC61RT87_9FIRM|nr:hypothetical protein [Petralouisia muris]TGY93678.1 hypothetical protein E5329_17280 [Petralouisia muris]
MSLGGVLQYQTNTASNTQTLGNVKETIGARPVAQAQELMPGKVFEGMVTEIKNGQVTLGLSDGRTISARMEAGVNLEKGQPMLFEVKANTGEQISIRPVTLESAQNPTLMKALEAAGLKVTPRNLSMVNEMMMEQLPIDKGSLMQMARAAANFPEANMQTLVQMQKLGIVITENSLNQFQNYQNGQQAILPQMQELMDGIADLPQQLFGKEGIGPGPAFSENFNLGDSSAAAGAQNQETGQILGLQRQILSILLGGQEAGAIQNGEALNQKGVEPVNPNGAQAISNGEPSGQLLQEQPVQNGEVSNQSGAQILQDGAQLAQAVQNGEPSAQEIPNQAIQKEGNTGQGQAVSNQAQQSPEAISGSGQESLNPMDQILDKGQQENLANILKGFPGAAGNEQLLPQGQLNASLSAQEMLQQIMQFLDSSGNLNGNDVKKLFSSKEFKGLMKQAMTEQWMLTPEQLKEEGAVKELYQRLTRQMTELQQALSQVGKEGTALAKTAQSVQSNLDFMNQLNQVCSYVQLPLKLKQQNAHSDLYVYTNKKSLREKEGDLSALLHLDLEHLGSTDIYVKMHGSSVQTDFYLADELSFRLIGNFTDQLVERLREKGYSCEVKVENRKPQKNSVQDFLDQEKPAGKLHRYSFDVKA